MDWNVCLVGVGLLWRCIILLKYPHEARQDLNFDHGYGGRKEWRMQEMVQFFLNIFFKLAYLDYCSNTTK